MSTKLKNLNVGCGKRFHPDWFNTDILPADPAVIHIDVTKDYLMKMLPSVDYPRLAHVCDACDY